LPYGEAVFCLDEFQASPGTASSGSVLMRRDKHLRDPAHHLVVFTFVLVYKRIMFFYKPLFFWTPVPIFKRFIATVSGDFCPLSPAYSDSVSCNFKFPYFSHLALSLVRPEL
jgi:hypothetical protein